MAAGKELSLKIIVNGVVKDFIGNMKNAGTAVEELGKKALSIGASFAKVGGVMTAAFVPAIYNAQKFQKQIAEIATLGVENTKQLSNDLTDMMVKYGQSIDGITKASYDAVSAGISEEHLKQFMEIANEAAIGGKASVDVMADALTTAKNAWQLDMADMSGASNSFFAAVKYGKTTMTDLASNIGQVTGVAGPLGVSLDETLASVSALTLGGLSTSESITQLKAVMNGLMKPADSMKVLLDKWGYSSGQAAIESLGFSGVLERLRSEVGGDTTALGELFGSVEAVSGALSLTGAQFGNYNKALTAMKTETDLGAKATEKMTNTFSFQFDRMKSGAIAAMKDIGVPIADVLIPYMKKAADMLGEMSRFFRDNAEVIKLELNNALSQAVEIFKKLFGLISGGSLDDFRNKIQTMGPVIAKWLARIMLLGPALLTIGGILASVGAAFVVMGTVISTAASFLSVLLTPMGLVAAGLAALIVSLTGFGDSSQSIWESIKEYTMVAVNYLMELFAKIQLWWEENGPAIKEKAVELFTKIWTVGKSMMQSVWEIVKKVWDDLKNIWMDLIAWWQDESPGIIESVKTVFTEIWNAAKEAWNGILEVTQSVWEALGPIIELAMIYVTSIIEATTGKINEIWEKHGVEIKEAVTIIWDTVVNTLKDILSFVGTWVSQFNGLIGPKIKEAFEYVIDILTNYFMIFVSLIRLDFENVQKYTQAFRDSIVNLITKMFEIMTDVAAGFFLTIEKKWDWLWNKINSIFSSILDLWKQAQNVMNLGIDKAGEMIQSVIPDFNLNAQSSSSILNSNSMNLMSTDSSIFQQLEERKQVQEINKTIHYKFEAIGESEDLKNQMATEIAAKIRMGTLREI